MPLPKDQVNDVNHFDNKIVVKYEDGTVMLVDGEALRKQVDAEDASKLTQGDSAMDVAPGPDALKES